MFVLVTRLDQLTIKLNGLTTFTSDINVPKKVSKVVYPKKNMIKKKRRRRRRREQKFCQGSNDKVNGASLEVIVMQRFRFKQKKKKNFVRVSVVPVFLCL